MTLGRGRNAEGWKGAAQHAQPLLSESDGCSRLPPPPPAPKVGYEEEDKHGPERHPPPGEGAGRGRRRPGSARKPPAAAAQGMVGRAAGPPQPARPRDPPSPPPRPPGDHRYETAADGHTREVHGDMVGPDEEEVLLSEDSDKVGYA
jgi:hypothetical protein